MEEQKRREMWLRKAFAIIYSEPLRYTKFKIEISGRHSPVYFIYPHDQGIIIHHKNYFDEKNKIPSMFRWINVDISGLLFEFVYSWRPVLIRYENIMKIDLYQSNKTAYIQIHYSTNKTKVIKVTLSYFNHSVTENREYLYVVLSSEMQYEILSKIRDKLIQNIDRSNQHER